MIISISNCRQCWIAAVMGLLAGGLFFPVSIARGDSPADATGSDVPPSAAARVEIVADRDAALYDCGDPAAFTVTVTHGDRRVTRGVAKVKLTEDGGRLISETAHDLAQGNPFTITAQLDHAGFVRCDFMGLDQFANVRARAAAGFAVEHIAPGRPEPADFDAFWASLLARQAEIVEAVSCEPLPDKVGKPGYRYFKLSAKTVDDGMVHGFLGIPAGRPGPFTALVLVAGAGPGYDAPDPTFIRPDMMTLAINLHPLDPTASDFPARYQEMTATQPYWAHGAPDRDRYYFRRALLGTHAMVEWLAAHPQFNGRDLRYLGASQGGGFGLMLAGLNHRFTAVAASVPALSDHGGVVAGRTSGWPQLIQALADDAESQERLLGMSGYFDAAHFARRVACPVVFTVGFCDATCSPSSVYAAFNAVKTPKFIMTAPLADHPVPWEHLNGIWQWLQNGLDEQHRVYRTYFKY